MDIDGFEAYLDRQVDRGNLSQDTRRAYVGAVERFADWFAAPGEEPTIQDFKDYLLAASVGDVTGTEKTGGSLNVEKSAFRKYLHVQGRADEYEDLKMWFSEHFRVSTGGTPDHLREDELDAIRETAQRDPREQALVAIFSETGIRIGELIRLDRDDVLFNASLPQGGDAPAVIEIQRQKRGEAVTDRRPLSQEAADAIETYLDSLSEYVDAPAVASDGLFPTPFLSRLDSTKLPSGIGADTTDEHGNPATYRATTDGVNRWLKNIAADTDHPDVTRERMHAHLFRHTLGTHLGEEGYSAEQIGAFLGRASAAEEYVHLEDAGVVLDMAAASP